MYRRLFILLSLILPAPLLAQPLEDSAAQNAMDDNPKDIFMRAVVAASIDYTAKMDSLVAKDTQINGFYGGKCKAGQVPLIDSSVDGVIRYLRLHTDYLKFENQDFQKNLVVKKKKSVDENLFKPVLGIPENINVGNPRIYEVYTKDRRKPAIRGVVQRFGLLIYCANIEGKSARTCQVGGVTLTIPQAIPCAEGPGNDIDGLFDELVKKYSGAL